jgi:hypothetical protein
MPLNPSNLGWYWAGAFTSCVLRLVTQESERYGIPGWTDVALLMIMAAVYSAAICVAYIGYGFIRNRVSKKAEERRYHILPLILGALVPHAWLPILRNEFIPIPDSFWAVFVIVSILSFVAFETNQIIRIKN